jgi:hypothetical protein
MRSADSVLSRADLSVGNSRASNAQVQRVLPSWQGGVEHQPALSKYQLERQNALIESGRLKPSPFSGRMKYSPMMKHGYGTPDFRPPEHPSSNYSQQSLSSAYMKSPSYHGAESEVEEVTRSVEKSIKTGKKKKSSGSKGSKGAVRTVSKGAPKKQPSEFSLADKRKLLQEDEEFVSDSDDEREEARQSTMQVESGSSGDDEESEDEEPVAKVPKRNARMLKSRSAQMPTKVKLSKGEGSTGKVRGEQEKKPQVKIRRLKRSNGSSLVACADTGAEEHVINRLSCFVPGTYEEYSERNPAPIDLLTANGQSMPVLGRGDISEHVQGAFYVPSSQSLISLPILRNKNCWSYGLPKNISPDYSMLIFDEDGQLIMVADDNGDINFDFECPKFRTLFQDFKPLIDLISSMWAKHNSN